MRLPALLQSRAGFFDPVEWITMSTLTLGFLDENGNWVAVSEDNPLPVEETA